jgi:hypothetical protein
MYGAITMKPLWYYSCMLIQNIIKLLFIYFLEPGTQWLPPIILSTQEAEIRRIFVQDQPWANRSRNPISKNQSQKKKKPLYH